MWQVMKQKGKDLRAQAVVSALNKAGYEAHYVPGLEDAKEKVLSLIPAGARVGCGGSVTIRELGLLESLRERGCEVLDHWQPGLSHPETLLIRREQVVSEVFLTSSNAVTMSGELVNIDGAGNRVSATIFGPKKVIVVVGVNKIVKDVAAGIERSQQVAAVMNAARLKRDTPCTKTGKCTDCNSAERICNVTVILHRRPRDKGNFSGDFNVIVVGEELGF
ncbi:hypothetical protein SY88_06165 [Clostridiales bacterium PH28_bin88]|nr:hypothetical protein SY88_06165 [Clostridiales bacterium PH28_bin88]